MYYLKGQKTLWGKKEQILPSIPLFYPFPKRQILNYSKLKDLADDSIKFDENGIKFSKQVENIVGKGGIAHYEQFLLFPQCFQDLNCRHVKTRACLGKG